MITYNTTILGDSQELKKLLEFHRFVFNYASKQQLPEQKNSLVVLHSKAACCGTAINDNQQGCPRCHRHVVGDAAPSIHERHLARWKNATRFWKRQ